MNLKKLHFISGIIITAFITLHLSNHVIAVLGAVAVQIFSGLKLFFSRRKFIRGFFQKLQLYSGLYLAIFLVIHVAAVVMGRLVMNLDTNFYFGVAGLNTFPFSLFFVPYYALAILAFFGHIASIHSQKMKQTILGQSAQQQARWILALGAVLTLVIFYGLTNGFSGVEIPDEYKSMIGQ